MFLSKSSSSHQLFLLENIKSQFGEAGGKSQQHYSLTSRQSWFSFTGGLCV